MIKRVANVVETNAPVTVDRWIIDRATTPRFHSIPVGYDLRWRNRGQRSSNARVSTSLALPPFRSPTDLLRSFRTVAQFAYFFLNCGRSQRMVTRDLTRVIVWRSQGRRNDVRKLSLFYFFFFFLEKRIFVDGKYHFEVEFNFFDLIDDYAKSC